MDTSFKDSIYRQRDELARMLREPIDRVAQQLAPIWNDRQQTEAMLQQNFTSIPYCSGLYLLNTDGIQICDTIGPARVVAGHFGRDRSERPYMKEAVPAWGFLLSDAYISQFGRRPSLTALQIIRVDNQVLGYLGADFDLRNLPVTAELYQEPENWRQIKGDPAIRSLLFLQTRVENPMDRNMEQALAILEEMLTHRGVFQALINFPSSQATIWTRDNPFRYRILDIEALTDPDMCLVYPSQPYPPDALIPSEQIAVLLENFKELRMVDENIYLRTASINLYNGLVSVTLSCDGSHYIPYEEFLSKNTKYWFGAAA